MFLHTLTDEVFQEQAEPFRLVRPAQSVRSASRLSHLDFTRPQFYLLLAAELIHLVADVFLKLGDVVHVSF